MNIHTEIVKDTDLIEKTESYCCVIPDIKDPKYQTQAEKPWKSPLLPDEALLASKKLDIF